jgi:SAM-dependent methyltransferase
MPDYRHIYRTAADAYDRMVAAEDVDGAVIAALGRDRSLVGARVVEVGVGTGRVTRQLVSAGAIVSGVEPEPAMLAIARAHVAALGGEPERLVAGTLDALPFADASADLGVSAWVFAHQRSFEPELWRGAVDAGVGELRRVVRPGGSLVLFETLGTGTTEPGVRADLEELYRHLETRWGFSREVLRTDFQFETAVEAAETLQFFFGDDFARKVIERGWARVPEWTACFRLSS